MGAKYILAVLGAGFLIAGALRLARDGGKAHPQNRTWFLIGVIFSGVSGWLWLRA